MTHPTLFDQAVRHELPDGSVCVVEARDSTSSMISREVDGRCVWGQAFSRGENHEGQVAAVVDGMRRDPLAHTRHGWDPATGRAYDGPHAPACTCGECP